MASYTVLASQSTTQVLSPTLVVDAFQVTLQTSPSGVIATETLEQSYFDDGQAPTFLQQYADAIEAIMSSGMVIAGVGTQALDASGLLEDGVTFTVGYTPPNSQTGPLTVEVFLTNGTIIAGSVLPLGATWTAAITDAYNNLIVLSGGTPPATGGTGGGTTSGTGGGTPPPPPLGV